MPVSQMLNYTDITVRWVGVCPPVAATYPTADAVPSPRGSPTSGVCVCTCACARVCDVAVGQSLCQFPFTFSKLLRGLLLCEKPVAY